MKRNYLSSKLLAHLNAGNLSAAKMVAQYEEISPSTEFTLLSMAPHVPSVCEIIRIILQRCGFSRNQAKFRLFVEQYEAEVVLSRNWKKVLDLVNDAPLRMPALTAMLGYLYMDIDKPEAVEVFKLYQKKYDFNKIVWPEELKEMLQNIVAEITAKLSLS